LVHSVILKELEAKNENKDNEVFKGILVKILKSSARVINQIS
jgi:hypothetical protein